MTTVAEIINKIEGFAPTYLAENWDPIGLSIGNYNQKVAKMMVALDLDANTLQEAKELGVDFIFTHHPAIFSSLKTLNEEDSRRREYIELIRSNISLYSAHTNVDAADNGMNDWLAEAIGLETPFDFIDFSYAYSIEMVHLYADEAVLEGVTQELDQLTRGELREHNPSLYKHEGKEVSSPFDLGAQTQKVELVAPTNLKRDITEKLDEMAQEKRLSYHVSPIKKKGRLME